MKINLTLPGNRPVTIQPDRRNMRVITCMQCKQPRERFGAMRVLDREKQADCPPARLPVMGYLCSGCLLDLLDDMQGTIFQRADCGGETVYYQGNMLVGVSVEIVREAVIDCRRALLTLRGER